jgi:hypothetical protein
MKDFTELLMHIIAQETKYIETMRHSLKEDKLTILRLKNKTRAIEKEINGRKKSIEEYRGYLRHISDPAKLRMKLVAPTTRKIDMALSNTNIQFERCIENQV